MKKTIRTLLCVLLALTLCLSMTACGGNETPGQSETPPSAQGTQAAPEQSGGESAATGTEGETPAEELVYNGLFATDRVHSVEVTLAEEDLDDLRANPLEKTKYEAVVVIDGERLEGVSFATKGNTSLSSVASDPDSDRYSFKLNFGKYNKGQTYHGLNKLNLNNLYADATYMKDYLSYWLFRQLGVDAPLTSYVQLTVNGEDHGLYIAIEEVAESWMDRTNEGEGVLYKPEAESLDQAAQPDGNGQQPTPPGGNGQGGFPGGNGEQPTPPDGSGEQPTPPDGSGQQPTPPDGSGQGGFPGGNGQGGFPGGNGQGGFPGGNGQGGFPGGQGGEGGFPGGNGEGGFPGGQGGPGGMGESEEGADLVYRGDELESYPEIFDNAETDADEEDEQRVVAALKALSEGRDLDEYLDTEEILRYFAVHNFVLNYDSYTGTMLHNYYLYEKDGKLSMLPWDYNLAFGAFGGGQDATALINTGIDTPLSGTSEERRPMWAWIAADESRLARYHEICEELLAIFESGAFERELEAVSALIRPYVEKDPTAFYTLEEFDAAVPMLKQFCSLRAESVRAQLDGKLSTKTSEQDAAARIDASGLTISVMGSQGGGPGGPGGEGGFPGGFGGEGGFPGGNGQGGFPGFPGGEPGQGFPDGSGGEGGPETTGETGTNT